MVRNEYGLCEGWFEMRLTITQWNHAMKLHDDEGDKAMLVYIRGLLAEECNDYPSIDNLIQVEKAITLGSVLNEDSWTDVEMKYNMVKDLVLDKIKPEIAKIDFDKGIALLKEQYEKAIAAKENNDVESFVACVCCSVCSGSDDIKSGVFKA